jgi:hypothetical protein
MSECIAERKRTQGHRVVVEVWHLAGAKGDSWWRPIKCGDGITLPGHSVEREPTCPECLAMLAPSTGRRSA